MLGLLHRLAAQPWIYDRIQALSGQDLVFRRMSRRISGPPPATVLDVGGGTGAMRPFWPPDCRYLCLDLEMPKLRRFHARSPDGLALLADATGMPLQQGSVDVVLTVAVLHHLTDPMVEQTLEECRRVLAPAGRLILLDPVWAPHRLLGRLLWSLDRGAWPRTAPVLRRALEKNFRVTHWETFAVFHEYAFGIAELRRPDGSGAGPDAEDLPHHP